MLISGQQGSEWNMTARFFRIMQSSGAHSSAHLATLPKHVIEVAGPTETKNVAWTWDIAIFMVPLHLSAR